MAITAKSNRRRVKAADTKAAKAPKVPKFAPSEDYIQADLVLGNVHIEFVTDGDVPYMLVAVPIGNNADATVTDKGNTLTGTTGGWKKIEQVPGLSVTVAAVLSNKRK